MAKSFTKKLKTTKKIKNNKKIKTKTNKNKKYFVWRLMGVDR
jgi:hypothetical protein